MIAQYRFPPGTFDKRAIVRRAQGTTPLRRTLDVDAVYASAADPDLHVRLRRVFGDAADERTVLTVERRRRLPMHPAACGVRGACCVVRWHDDATKSYELADGDMAAAMLGALLARRPTHTLEKFRDVIDVPGLGAVAFDEFPGAPSHVMVVESPTQLSLDLLIRKLGLAPPNEARAGGRDISRRDLRFDAKTGAALRSAIVRAVDLAEFDSAFRHQVARASDLRDASKNRARMY